MQRKADQIRAEISTISGFLKAGRADRAFQRATKAAKKWSDVSAFPRLAGLCAVQQQKPKLAQTYFERAWRLDPSNKELIQNYAMSLVQGGVSADALKFLDKIAARAPLPPEQLFIRAMALMRERKTAEAMTVIEEVLSHQPDNLPAYGLKADILDEMHRWDQAVDVLEELVAKNPKFHFSQLRLAKAYVAAGRLKDGLNTARIALKLSPLDGETFRFMTKLPNLTDSDVEMLREQVAKALASDQTGSRENLAALHFAAATLALKDKDHTREFHHLELAHASLAEGGQELEKQRQQEFRKCLAAPLPMAEVAPRQDAPRPVFVVGLPRSGTTLVERMLAAHSGIQGLGELVTVRHWVTSNTPDELGGLADYYTEKLPEIAEGTQAFVDKMPGNYAYIGQIAQAFPDAVIVNMQRDPRDIALSMWREFFGARGLYFTHNFKWMAAEANRYQGYMQHWNTVLPDRIHTLRYEDLVSNPEQAVRQLAKLCGVAFEDGMLSPQESTDAVRTASVLQVRKPVNTSSIGGWQVAGDVLAPFVSGLDPDLWPEVVGSAG